MDEIRDFVDYEAVGDFVVQTHTTDPLLAKVMCMQTGRRWFFDGETCLQDATRAAFDKHFALMYGT